jgi:hypothetical protein
MYKRRGVTSRRKVVKKKIHEKLYKDMKELVLVELIKYQIFLNTPNVPSCTSHYLHAARANKHLISQHYSIWFCQIPMNTNSLRGVTCKRALKIKWSLISRWCDMRRTHSWPQSKCHCLRFIKSLVFGGSWTSNPVNTFSLGRSLDLHKTSKAALVSSCAKGKL